MDKGKESSLWHLCLPKARLDESYGLAIDPKASRGEWTEVEILCLMAVRPLLTPPREARQGFIFLADCCKLNGFLFVFIFAADKRDH